jgi:hypothetical protein
MRQRIFQGAVLIALSMAAAGATAQSASWTVKPEWVRAHEDFLASDAMRGRGSATHDEEVAATYVASEFEGYGLTHAPGMESYIQSATVSAPELDGKATVTVGGVTLNEGPGFDLMMSPGTPVSGPLVRVNAADAGKAKLERGAIVLVPDTPADPNAVFGLLRPLRRAGAAAVLLAGSPDGAKLIAMAGGKTQTPIRLADIPPARAFLTVAVLKEPLTASSGTVTIDVHAVPATAPRQTYNAIGYLAGSDPHAGTILLTAHLDHLGVHEDEKPDPIYNGANDDAAGTTAVLELAHALATGPKLRRSVLFVCYGSEELGGLGSTYFGEHPPVPLKDLVANLEFEMIGAQDPKMPKGVLLLTGWDRSNLGPTLKAHGALLGPDPYPEQHFFERSDNYSLALKGVVAHTAAGWGTVPTYHQPNDDLAHLDLPFMTAAIQSLVEPVRWLAESDFVPKWNEGGRPKP